MTTAEAPRSRIPPFVSDLWQDRSALDVLIAAALAVAAVGVDPRQFAPGMPDVQSALRERPELESLLILAAVVGAGVILFGGALSDALRSRRLLLGGLAVLLAAQLARVVVADGGLYVIASFAAIIAGGIVLPFAIASVALAYQGAARATALGVVYGVMGAAAAVPAPLLLLFAPDGTRMQAYLVAALVAGAALAWARRRMPDMPGAERGQRPFIIGTALWAFGVVALVGGIVTSGAWTDPIRLVTIFVGGVSLLGYWFWRRHWRRIAPEVHVEMRPVSAVLAVGIFLGLGQAAPMLQIPLFFQLIQQYPPLLATIAIAPFVGALLLAGPVSGWLLARYTPRVLVVVGTVALGVGDIGLALVVGRDAIYPLFVVPFVLVGAGFVIAATVRTAVIFASVPRRLPATAAALNEASIGMGVRIGLVLATVIVAEVTIATYAGSLGTLPPAELEAALAPLRDVLGAIGRQAPGSLVVGIDRETVAVWADAYVDGVRWSHLLIGAATVAGGLVAGLLLGRRDPLKSVWEHRDEREEPAVSVEQAAG